LVEDATVLSSLIGAGREEVLGELDSEEERE
jgi:hypothetical protein